MRQGRPESIHCSDCGRPGFSALSCPECGEVRRLRAERRNTLIVTTVACGCLGGLYGSLLGASTSSTAILAGYGYGMVGVLVGVLIGFAINLTRGRLR
jgi:hypothetical protein